MRQWEYGCKAVERRVIKVGHQASKLSEGIEGTAVVERQAKDARSQRSKSESQVKEGSSKGRIKQNQPRRGKQEEKSDDDDNDDVLVDVVCLFVCVLQILPCQTDDVPTADDDPNEAMECSNSQIPAAVECSNQVNDAANHKPTKDQKIQLHS